MFRDPESHRRILTQSEQETAEALIRHRQLAIDLAARYASYSCAMADSLSPEVSDAAFLYSCGIKRF